jgi:16S rRNA (cytidine1402-2'-O)-methyltransferase
MPEPAPAGLTEQADMEVPSQSDCWAPQPLWTASGLDQQELPRALYVVATPIGNAADVSLRALWVLRNADCIAAEDTRVTAPLLQRYGIRTPLAALHRHNEHGASAALLARLARGERVALVSDAGTPGICDPGAVLVRAALSAGLRVIPIPGASSLTAAVSAAGLQAASVCLIGFLPTRVQARLRLLRQAAAREDAFVLFEAPHRIERTAGELSACLEPERRVVLARELTKLFEAVVQTTAAGLPDAVAQQGGRGEFVVLVDGPAAPAAGEAALDEAAMRWLQALARELPAARAAAVVSQVTGVDRAQVYAAVLRAQGAGSGAASDA